MRAICGGIGKLQDINTLERVRKPVGIMKLGDILQLNELLGKFPATAEIFIGA